MTILLLLTERTFGERFHRSRWAGMISVFEPLGVIFIFTMLHQVGPSTPPYGSSTALFFATGVIPFYMFFHVSVRLRGIDTFPSLPPATRLHHVLARCIGEYLTKAAIFVLFLFLIAYANGYSVEFPSNLLMCAVAMAATTVLGASVGLINACIISIFPSWVYIYAVVGRVMMVISGIPFVHDRAPPILRNILDWSPICHWLTYFRLGFYGPGYPIDRLDMPYALWITCGALALASMLDISTREYRSTERVRLGGLATGQATSLGQPALE